VAPGDEVADGDFPLLTESRTDPGSELTILEPVGSTNHCLVKGPVTAQRIHLAHGGTGSWVEVHGADNSIRMDRESKAAIWSDISDSDAVNSILSSYGFTPDIAATAVYIANYLRRSFPMVERDDILQEIFAWVASHGEKLEQWGQEGAHGLAKAHKSMRHAGLKYCQDEKAAILGYRPEDVYYYETGLIKDALTRIWDEEAWISPPQPSDQTKVKHRAVSEGNNYATTLCDVSRVVGQLEDGERSILELHFRDGYGLGEIADLLDTTRAAVEGRITRLIKKLQRMLGGERPNVRD